MRGPVCAVLLAAMIATMTDTASAQRVVQCRITDPTGTPLNVRQGPQGRIIGTIRNGVSVHIAATARDHKGQPWAQIVEGERGRTIGWVIREHVSCY